MRQLALGGGMLAFELAGGRAAGRAFIDALAIPELTASLGSVFTMVVHPPSTTHRQLDDAALANAGITAGLLRCSVGLEDLDDLVADFERGLAAASAAGRTRRHATAATSSVRLGAFRSPVRSSPGPPTRGPLSRTRLPGSGGQSGAC